MAKHKLLITDGLASEGLKLLEQSGLYEVTLHKSIDKEELKKIIGSYEVVIIRSATKLTKDLIDAATSLKVIMRAGAGVDNVDVKAATEKKVLVFNCPGVNNQAVAELTLGFLFGLVREIPRATGGMKKNLWEKKELVGFEVQGRTMGVLGMGAIGAIVARSCHALGMKVVAFDPRHAELAKDSANSHVSKWCGSVDEVFQSSDVVSLHMPLIPDTKNSIGKKQFSLLKKGSYFINCARGGIANEADLLAALNDGAIAGAALDVFDVEPVPADHPLVMHPKVICSPHIGAATKESQTKIGIAAATHLVNFHRDGLKPTAVNGKDL